MSHKSLIFTNKYLIQEDGWLRILSSPTCQKPKDLANELTQWKQLLTLKKTDIKTITTRQL